MVSNLIDTRSLTPLIIGKRKIEYKAFGGGETKLRCRYLIILQCIYTN